jgi:hypothetical protein
MDLVELYKNRYRVQIKFKESEPAFDYCTPNWVKKMEHWDISETFKSLEEAKSYKSLMDSSVSKARLIDELKGRIIEIWV